MDTPYPMPPELAEARGVGATVMTTQRKRRIEFSVAVTSGDPQPTLSIRSGSTGSRASDMLLGERQQFGPESWDYPAAVTAQESTYVIRLSAGSGAPIDVPLLGAAALVVASGRWPAEDYVVAGVDASRFVQALELMVAGPKPPDTGDVA